MSEVLKPDLCVIGAGSGGLSVAAAAAALGVEVVLIEKGKMGGDCLNYGCVPSKAMIAAARRAHQMRTAEKFGMTSTNPMINPAAVHDHVKSVIAAIEPNDSVERFTGLGVHVIEAPARFADGNTVIAGDNEIKARRFIIATGSSPAIPPIPGLADVSYFTNETIFDNRTAIEHLIVIGGGPIGMELAQAHLRLGSRVTVIEAMKALGKDDKELTDIVLKSLTLEGLELREGARVESIARSGEAIRVKISENGVESEIEGSHLLVATGRKPNVDDLDLAVADIKYDNKGIKVSKGLKTSNRRVYAIGDVTGGLQFTHVANYHAGLVVRNALFRIPVSVNNDIIPWVTFTDPELAHVGLMEEEARKRHKKINVLRWPYHENDRAQAERETTGFIKVITKPNGQILGASIVGEHAGEVIQMWALAISKKMKIGAFTGFVSPYPTFTEINKRVAIIYYLPKLTSQLLQKAISILAKLG